MSSNSSLSTLIERSTIFRIATAMSLREGCLNQGSATKYLSTGPSSDRLVDLRLISLMRLLLALAAPLVVRIDPSEPSRLVGFTYLTLVGYSLYSAAIYILSVRRSAILPLNILHWLDLAWYIPLIALTGGANSIFFFFLSFVILVASFECGFGTGLLVTVTAAVLFTIIGYATAPTQPEFRLNSFLMRPIYLLVIGYLIAFWGGTQSRLKARLDLMKQVTLLSNPRFGVDRTIQSVLESLRSYYQADTSLLILPKTQAVQSVRLYGRATEGPYNLYCVDRNSSDLRNQTRELTEEMTQVFLTDLPAQALIYRKAHPGEIFMYEPKTGAATRVNSRNYAFINMLEGKSCFSVPVHSRGQAEGRLYIVGGARRFDYAEVEFVSRVMEHVTRVLDNIRLVDGLASDAAREERRKIAQDIHDSVIQPYIGIQIGLTGLKQKLQTGADVKNEVQELLDLTNDEIAGLRNYVGGLKRDQSANEIFVPAVRRFAARFSEVTGLNVEINASDDLPVYDRLAAELFQMIEEGLSNVRRHSNASKATVEIGVKDDRLELQIRNHRSKRLGAASFTPRSIADRASALGGQTRVYTDKNNDTVVSVQIPL
jgi:signal transduction histidine kinase